jgi:hypothetical protein
MADEGQLPTGEDLLATACSFLADGGNHHEAALLSSCALNVTYVEDGDINGDWLAANLLLVCTREALDVFEFGKPQNGAFDFLGVGTTEPEPPSEIEKQRERMMRALRLSLPAPYQLGTTDLRAMPVQGIDAWRARFATPQAAPPRELPPA